MPTPPNKLCPRCKEQKPAVAFGRDKSTRTGLTSYCLACRKAVKAAWELTRSGEAKAYARKWRAMNVDKIRRKALERYHAMSSADRERWKSKQRAAHLRRKYGMTAEELDLLIAMHDNGCAICGAKFTDAPRGDGAMAVDHDHSTNRVRGLLCFKCNAGIGYFGDSPDVLVKAADYLRRQHPNRLVAA